MQTTLQRCPSNSVEQLGQMDDASVGCTFAGARFAAMPADVATVVGAVVEPDELSFGFGIELMSVVVAQNRPREKIAN